MNLPYVNRLRFFSKISFNRAINQFQQNNSEEYEDDFFLSLLEKGKEFEFSTVVNAMNFADSWKELGKDPSPHVLNRLLYLTFLQPKFVNQFIFFADTLEDFSWLFNGLAKIIVNDFKTFKESINEDHPIWAFLIDKINQDIEQLSEKNTPKIRYRDREVSYIGEVIPLYWPYDSTSFIKVKDLVESFCSFCIEAKTKYSIELFNIFCLIFPKKIPQIIKANLNFLNVNTFTFLIKYNFIRFPRAGEGLSAKISLKTVEIDPKTSIEFATKCTNKEESELVIKALSCFNTETHKFRFDDDE